MRGVELQRAPLQYGLKVRKKDFGKYIVAVNYYDESCWRFMDSALHTAWRKGKDGCAWFHKAFCVQETVKAEKRTDCIVLGFKVLIDPKNPLCVLLVPDLESAVKAGINLYLEEFNSVD